MTRSAAGGGSTPGAGRGWRSVAWKLAVAVSLIATAFGVCQVNRAARRPPPAVDPEGRDRMEDATEPDMREGRDLPATTPRRPAGFP